MTLAVTTAEVRTAITKPLPRATRRHRNTPRVRRTAHELGVALEHVHGTGPGGRVTVLDLRHAARQPAETPAAGPSTAQTSVVEVDVSAIERLQTANGQPPSLAAFFAAAALDCLRSEPALTAMTDGADVHLGVAVDTDRGRVVPVIREAGQLNLTGLSRRIEEMTRAARAGAASDVVGATFVIADTGSHGALFDTPVLSPGGTASLGVGAIVPRPVVVTGRDGQPMIGIRSMVYLALTYDTQVVDAAAAARFLHAVKTRVEAGQSSS